MQSIGFDTYTTNGMTSIPNGLKRVVKKSGTHSQGKLCTQLQFGLLCTRLTKPSRVFEKFNSKGKHIERTKGQVEK